MFKYLKLKEIEIINIKNRLSYDSITGFFTYKVVLRQHKQKETVLGNAGKKDKYISIKFANKTYKAHRLAWLFYYNEQPDSFIDHIDGNMSNNAISNLRLATNGENIQNQKKAQANSITGFLGVYKNNNNKENPYRASIKFNKENFNIGSFLTPELAHDAYIKKKRELHKFCTI